MHSVRFFALPTKITMSNRKYSNSALQQYAILFTIKKLLLFCPSLTAYLLSIAERFSEISLNAGAVRDICSHQQVVPRRFKLLYILRLQLRIFADRHCSVNFSTDGVACCMLYPFSYRRCIIGGYTQVSRRNPYAQVTFVRQPATSTHPRRHDVG